MSRTFKIFLEFTLFLADNFKPYNRIIQLMYMGRQSFPRTLFGWIKILSRQNGEKNAIHKIYGVMDKISYKKFIFVLLTKSISKCVC